MAFYHNDAQNKAWHSLTINALLAEVQGEPGSPSPLVKVRWANVQEAIVITKQLDAVV